MSRRDDDDLAGPPPGLRKPGGSAGIGGGGSGGHMMMLVVSDKHFDDQGKLTDAGSNYIEECVQKNVSDFNTRKEIIRGYVSAAERAFKHGGATDDEPDSFNIFNWTCLLRYREDEEGEGTRRDAEKKAQNKLTLELGKK